MYIVLGSIVIFIMLILPIKEHDISLNLFVSFLISFISTLYFSEYRSLTFYVGLCWGILVFLVVKVQGIVYLHKGNCPLGGLMCDWYVYSSWSSWEPRGSPVQKGPLPAPLKPQPLSSSTSDSFLLLCSHNGLLLVCVAYFQQLFLVLFHSLEPSSNLSSAWAITCPPSDLHVVPFFQKVLPAPSPPAAWGTPSLGSCSILCCL